MSDLLNKNYFELFDLAVQFEVDSAELSERYLALQKTTHPDRFVQASDQEKRLAMQVAAHVNSAYQCLRGNVSRAEYMLLLVGIEANTETDTTMDGAFLMQQMEWREQLADIPSKADPLTDIDTLAAEVGEHERTLLARFVELYSANDMSGAHDAVRKLQFMKKMQTELSELSAQIEDELLG